MSKAPRRLEFGSRIKALHRYEQNRKEKQLHLQRQQESLDKKRDHIQKSIQDGLRAAKKSGDDKKLGMVASRQRVRLCLVFCLRYSQC
jgi:hypothetical protein